MTPNPILLTLWLAELRAKWDRNDEVGTEHFHLSIGKVDYKEHKKMVTLSFLAEKQSDTDVGC